MKVELVLTEQDYKDLTYAAFEWMNVTGNMRSLDSRILRDNLGRIIDELERQVQSQRDWIAVNRAKNFPVE